MSNSHKINFNFELLLKKGSVPTPAQLKFWNPNTNKSNLGSPPLKYMADALVGLSFFRMNPFLRSPLFNPQTQFQFQEEAFKALDPHYEIYQKYQAKKLELTQYVPKIEKNIIENFEKKFSAILASAQQPWGMEFKDLFTLIDLISELESDSKTLLLYSYNFEFSKNFNQQLQSLYSLLFHVRCLAAVDYNAHTTDPTFEAIKVDSISDYLPKPEYVVNDALLYWNFTKLSHPWTHGKNHDVRIAKLFVKPFENIFNQYSHNACQLIISMPASYWNSLNQTKMEEQLYSLQMSWLLGTDAGLLFKIREELFGLKDGYSQLFWPELQESPEQKPVHLQLSCELKEQDLFSDNKAA